MMWLWLVGLVVVVGACKTAPKPVTHYAVPPEWTNTVAQSTILSVPHAYHAIPPNRAEILERKGLSKNGPPLPYPSHGSSIEEASPNPAIQQVRVLMSSPTGKTNIPLPLARSSDGRLRRSE